MTDLPPSWSIAEVCSKWDISPRRLGQLFASGRVGFYKGKRGARRLFAEHLDQLRAELEVKPSHTEDAIAIPGRTDRSAARRKSA